MSKAKLSYSIYWFFLSQWMKDWMAWENFYDTLLSEKIVAKKVYEEYDPKFMGKINAYLFSEWGKISWLKRISWQNTSTL